MAIKLADVIERNHASYPVIEAHDKTVVGFYNGASDDAQQALKLYWNSTVKTSLSSDGTLANDVRLTSLPYGDDGGANTAGPTDARIVPTEKGGILTMVDEKLLADNGSTPSNYVAAYLVNVVNNGFAVDTGRNSVGRLSELVQQFNRYETITGAGAAAANNADGENFFLAGYDTANNKMRKITWAELAGGIASQISTELVNTGVITETQAGGSGQIGDLNGDGNVSTADLLIMLQYMGQNDLGYETFYTTFDGSSESTTFVPGVSPFASAGTFALTDLFSFQYPTGLTVAGDAYGWTSVTTAVLQTNFVRFNTMALGSNDGLITSHWAYRRLAVEMDLTLNFDAPDSVFPLLYVLLTFEDDTTQECIYIMGSGNEAVNSLGLYSAGYGGQQGGIPIGFDVPVTVQADLGSLNILNYPPADNYENHSTAIESGFMMDHSNGSSNYIKHLETRIYFGAVTASTNVTVTEIRNRIYTQ